MVKSMVGRKTKTPCFLLNEITFSVSDYDEFSSY